MSFTSHKTFTESKGARILLTIGLMLVIVVIFVGVREYRKAQSYEGTIVEKDRSLKWRYWSETTRPDRTRYRHYLILDTDDGGEVRTRVRWQTYVQAEVGDPVVKRRGEYWPELMSEEAIERREGGERAMELILDAVRD